MRSRQLNGEWFAKGNGWGREDLGKETYVAPADTRGASGNFDGVTEPFNRGVTAVDDLDSPWPCNTSGTVIARVRRTTTGQWNCGDLWNGKNFAEEKREGGQRRKCLGQHLNVSR